MVSRGSARYGETVREIRGFTLLELALVVFVISLVLALSVPRLGPALAQSKIEGAARHLSGYGKALMAHCALTHEPVTFKVDLEEGEYWAVRWVDTDEEEEGEDSDEVNAAILSPEQEEELRAQEVEAQFQRFARLATQSRARHVPQDGILRDLDPLFEEEFSLDDEEDESERELKTDLLSRMQLPDDVTFDSVRIGARTFTSGEAEVDVTSLGLSDMVEFTLASGKRRYTVMWDAVTGDAHMEAGDLVDE